MRKFLVILLGSLFLLGFGQTIAQDATPMPQQGAFYTGEYPNILKESGISDAEIQQRIDATFQQLFYGDDNTERIYYPVGDDMAYITDVANDDVRSEGMSYGMMIAVQLDKQEEFNRLWKWAKTYMYQEKGQYKGYFAWHNAVNGKKLAMNPASDGEVWFATALFFAASRWGNGEGIFNYQAEANGILNTALHAADESVVAVNMFDPATKQIVFVAQPGINSEFTDPSYHMPHFFELWSKWADKDNDYWKEVTDISRAFLHTTADPNTGLMPDYAEFTGELHAAYNYGEFFAADAYRNAMNVAMDYSWFAADPWQVEQSNRLLNFFNNLGINSYGSKFLINGETIEPQHSTALVAANAVAALAATDDIRWDFVKAFWNTPIPSGHYRYYDGMLYMLALLELSGNFRIYAPPA